MCTEEGGIGRNVDAIQPARYLHGDNDDRRSTCPERGHRVNWGERDTANPAMIEGESSKVRREVGEWSKTEVVEPMYGKKKFQHGPDWGPTMCSGHNVKQRVS